METEAIVQLLALGRSGEIEIFGSPALSAENSLNPDPVRLARTREMLATLRHAPLGLASVSARALNLTRLGFASLDAHHIAWAEGLAASILLTIDDRLLALGARHRKRLEIRLQNPVLYIEELLK